MLRMHNFSRVTQECPTRNADSFRRTLDFRAIHRSRKLRGKRILPVTCSPHSVQI